MNDLPQWRRVYGGPRPDKRQRDVELILRFLGLLHGSDRYEKPMKDFLNRFMGLNRHATPEVIAQFRRSFTETTNTVVDQLGEKPFHIRAGLNAAVFDSIYVAFAKNLRSRRRLDSLVVRYKELLQDPEYLLRVGSSTTDKEVVRGRLALANQVLFNS
jgi:hypothetical protein